MNEEQEAANAVKFFLRGIRGLAKLEEPLLDLGSIKQAADEAASRVAKLQDEEAQARELLTKALVAVKAAEINAKDTVADGEAKAEHILAEARANADGINTKAKRSCQVIEEATKKKLTEIEKDIVTAEARYKVLLAEGDAAQTRYEALQSKLDEVIKSVKR